MPFIVDAAFRHRFRQRHPAPLEMGKPYRVNDVDGAVIFHIKEEGETKSDVALSHLPQTIVLF